MKDGIAMLRCAALVAAVMLPPAATAGADPAAFNTAEYWFESGRAAVARAARLHPQGWRAKNVILFVGDGMGVSTVTAARILAGQLAGRDGESHRLSFERFPHLALSVTASANQQTPDSAPTATAMVAGIKTNDGAISVGPGVERGETDAAVIAAHSVETILEQAEKRGLSTGIVTTARITHATPAVNYAHIGNRDWECDSDLPAGATVKDIARQLVEFPHGDGVDVVLGGGRRCFHGRDSEDPEYPGRFGRRADGRDLIGDWLAARPGSVYVWNQAQFDAVDPRRVRRLLGLFEPSHMRYEADRDLDGTGEPSLAEMTEKALRILQRNRKGYYLMVEAGRIDHAHHAGNAYRALVDTIALSDAVQKAVALTDPRDTLIIVTADHSHVFTIAGYPSRGNPILGKAAIEGQVLRDAFGLPYTTLSYANGPGYAGEFTRRVFDPIGERAVPAPYPGGLPRPDLSEIDTTDPNYLQEATVPLSSETHAGEDVAIYARGPGAQFFHGVQEQHVIYHVMAKALGFDHERGDRRGRGDGPRGPWAAPRR
ncbi:MAG: alkaline phosphatase [Gammaproteobacteria bacterium]|nr:MAG: alkaline phosphatase [Gammaproteobacteria bacterium]